MNDMHGPTIPDRRIHRSDGLDCMLTSAISDIPFGRSDDLRIARPYRDLVIRSESGRGGDGAGSPDLSSDGMARADTASEAATKTETNSLTDKTDNPRGQRDGN